MRTHILLSSERASLSCFQPQLSCTLQLCPSGRRKLMHTLHIGAGPLCILRAPCLPLMFQQIRLSFNKRYFVFLYRIFRDISTFPCPFCVERVSCGDMLSPYLNGTLCGRRTAPDVGERRATLPRLCTTHAWATRRLTCQRISCCQPWIRAGLLQRDLVLV